MGRLTRFHTRRAAKRRLAEAYRADGTVLHGLEVGDRVRVDNRGLEATWWAPGEHQAHGTVWWVDPKASTVILVQLDDTGLVEWYGPGDLVATWDPNYTEEI